MAFDEFGSGVAYVDGAAYVVCLPSGKLGRDAKLKEERFWDLVLDIAKEHGVNLHNQEIDSWCQEMSESLEEDPDSGEKYIEKSAAVRSTECCNNSIGFLTDARLTCIGFRPCLIPLDTETMSVIEGPWAGIRDGELVTFGSLYYGNEAVSVPTDCRKNVGDTPSRLGREALRIGDTSSKPGTEITWMKVGDVLVADRNLMVEISWDDLEKMGFAKVAGELRPIVEEAFDVKKSHQFRLDSLLSDATMLAKEVNKGNDTFKRDFVKE